MATRASRRTRSDVGGRDGGDADAGERQARADRATDHDPPGPDEPSAPGSTGRFVQRRAPDGSRRPADEELASRGAATTALAADGDGRSLAISEQRAARARDAPGAPSAARPALYADTRLEDLVVITGYSGAGKSTAMAVFEDAGYFCVDNLPPEMIRGLVELFVHEGSRVERAAVVSDVRGGRYFEDLRAVLDDLAALGLQHRVLFLDADEQTLLTRYKETRRRHPAARGSSVATGVATEQALLAAVKERADVVLDSTGLSAHTLRRKIADEFLPRTPAAKLALTLESFGFKHGPARDADLVLDVRFLPNPHYDLTLRPLTGHDPRVVAYVERDGRLAEFYAHVVPLLDFLLPQYVTEGKAHLTIAIGCTGGRHRSVAIVEHLAARYSARDDVAVEVTHRDVGHASGYSDADPASGERSGGGTDGGAPDTTAADGAGGRSDSAAPAGTRDADRGRR